MMRNRSRLAVLVAAVVVGAAWGGPSEAVASPGVVMVRRAGTGV